MLQNWTVPIHFLFMRYNKFQTLYIVHYMYCNCICSVDSTKSLHLSLETVFFCNTFDNCSVISYNIWLKTANLANMSDELCYIVVSEKDETL